MKRVLVTGAAGFVGRHSLAPPVARAYEVHAVASREVESPGVAWHRADLRDAARVSALVAEVRPSHLPHFAW
jgi:uncharacterized protein YbjT (DUF2867 family)